MAKEEYTPPNYRVVGKPSTANGKFIGVLVKDADRTNNPILTCGHRLHDSKKAAESCMRTIATTGRYNFNVVN